MNHRARPGYEDSREGETAIVATDRDPFGEEIHEATRIWPRRLQRRGRRPLDAPHQSRRLLGGEPPGGAANGPVDRLASGAHARRTRGAGCAGDAARLIDLAVAAAFAGGLGGGAGGEFDGFLARAAALLGGEAGGHSREDVMLVAQALASGVVAVGEDLAVAEHGGSSS